MNRHPLYAARAALPRAVLHAIDRINHRENAHHARVWAPGEIDAFERKMRMLHVMGACAVGLRLSLVSDARATVRG